MSTQPEFANVDTDAAVGEVQEQRAEQAEANAKAVQAARDIGKSLDDKTIVVEVEDVDVPFEPLRGRSDDVEDMMGLFADIDEDEMTREEFEEYRNLREEVAVILAEKCKLEDEAAGVFTAEWWQDNFSSAERQVYLGELANAGMEGARAEGFRP